MKLQNYVKDTSDQLVKIFASEISWSLVDHSTQIENEAVQ